MRVRINPDKDYVREIKAQLKKNNGHCPCKIIKTADTKCMCKEFREMVARKEAGMCHCGLYICEGGDE